MYAVLWPSSDLCRQLASSRIQTDKRWVNILFKLNNVYSFKFRNHSLEFFIAEMIHLLIFLVW